MTCGDCSPIRHAIKSILLIATALDVPSNNRIVKIVRFMGFLANRWPVHAGDSHRQADRLRGQPKGIWYGRMDSNHQRRAYCTIGEAVAICAPTPANCCVCLSATTVIVEKETPPVGVALLVRVVPETSAEAATVQLPLAGSPPLLLPYQHLPAASSAGTASTGLTASGTESNRASCLVCHISYHWTTEATQRSILRGCSALFISR